MHDALTSCFEVREKVPLYIGGDLEPEAMHAVRAHLGECRECAREAESAAGAMAAFRSALRSPEELTAPSLWAEVRTRIAAERASGVGKHRLMPAASPRPSLRRPVLRAVGGLAAVAALVVAALSIDLGGAELRPGPQTKDLGKDVVLNDVVLNAGEVGLKRVEPGEKTLFEQASPYGTRMDRLPMSPNSLAGHRTNAGRRIR
jgi:hypothetical protein